MRNNPRGNAYASSILFFPKRDRMGFMTPNRMIRIPAMIASAIAKC